MECYTSIYFTYFTYLLQQDETGCNDSTTEMETSVLDVTEDSYSEVDVEKMETKDSSPNNDE
jgi:hypothetical protein